MFSLGKTLLLCAFAVQAALCAPTQDPVTVFLIVSVDDEPYRTNGTCATVHHSHFESFNRLCQIQPHATNNMASCAVSAELGGTYEDTFKKACRLAKGAMGNDPFSKVKTMELWPNVGGGSQPVEACPNTIYPERIYPAFFYEKNSCVKYDLERAGTNSDVARCRMENSDSETKKRFQDSCVAASNREA
ncbi:hypothetical protein ACQY0O_007503 [Thecaphora frezii]